MNVEFTGICPERKHPTDAGADLRVGSIDVGTDFSYVDTLTAVAIPKGYAGLVFARSSLWKYGYALANGVGVIDSDYRGTIKAVLTRINQNPTKQLFAGDRFAQLVVVPVELASFTQVYTLGSTVRGDGSFGSTGNK